MSKKKVSVAKAGRYKQLYFPDGTLAAKLELKAERLGMSFSHLVITILTQVVPQLPEKREKFTFNLEI